MPRGTPLWGSPKPLDSERPATGSLALTEQPSHGVKPSPTLSPALKSPGRSNGPANATKRTNDAKGITILNLERNEVVPLEVRSGGEFRASQSKVTDGLHERCLVSLNLHSPGSSLTPTTQSLLCLALFLGLGKATNKTPPASALKELTVTSGRVMGQLDTG